MSSSYSITESRTFTVTHARHIAAKVATDLKRIQRLYGEPVDRTIQKYEAEATELLKAGYLEFVTYGFQRDGKWIEPALRYSARELASGAAADDDDPGRIGHKANTDGATFRSFLTYSSAWHSLTSAQQDAFKASLPIDRSNGPEPGIDGYLSNDRTYSSGGRALDRASVKSL